MTTHEYEIKLNLNEQRMALMSLAESVNKSYVSTKKMRKLRESEKAMALASLATKHTALLMAVDRLDMAISLWNKGLRDAVPMS
jgi:hypothetical protein